MDKEVLAALITDGMSIERIAKRFGLHPSTVGYWLRKHGLTAAHAARHQARGGIPRGQLERLIETGGTHRSIAADLQVSVATVRHWLKRYGLRTRASENRRQISPAAGDSSEFVGKCVWHGETRFVRRKDGFYRCVRCSAESVARRRRAVRSIVVEEAGGRCIACGYGAYLGALQFHHLDPRTKEFGLSSRGFSRSLERVRAEARKCVLLCANCHAEVEGGHRVLALELLKGLRELPSNPL